MLTLWMLKLLRRYHLKMKCSDCPLVENTVPQDSLDDFKKVHKILCEEDVLHWLTSQIDRSREFHLCVSRDDLIERGLKIWQRQKNGSPVNPLKITFIGEAGVDTGALRLEFSQKWLLAWKSDCLKEKKGKGKCQNIPSVT